MNELVKANVTCKTAGCLNQGYTLLVDVDSVDLNVICGACGIKIEPVNVLTADELAAL